MPKSNQEYSARRFQEFQPPQSPRYDAGYDCELPADARSELRPKRPVILEPPRVERSVKPDRSGALMWAGTVALVAIILAGVIGYYSEGLKQPATPKQSAPVAQPTPVPAQPVSQPPMPPPPAVLAPRARLVLYKRWAGNGVYELIDSTGRTVKNFGRPSASGSINELASRPIASGPWPTISGHYAVQRRGVTDLSRPARCRVDATAKRQPAR